MEKTVDSENIESLLARYREVRKTSERICEPLTIEDYVVQSHPDVSPIKWHLGHTTWFFQNLVLRRLGRAEDLGRNQQFERIFNSYYEGLARPWERKQRGFLARPDVSTVRGYRSQIDEFIERLLEQGEFQEQAVRMLEMGIQHEQQHQELMLMDILHNFSQIPEMPVYQPVYDSVPTTQPAFESRWIAFEEGIYSVGYGAQPNIFFYDNEGPVHRVFIEPFRLHSDLVTCGEFVEFIKDGGYEDFRHWLSDGWQWKNRHQVCAPLYWIDKDGSWFEKTLNGEVAIDMQRPVSHVSYYEACAFANWKGKRLPTEQEWEVAAGQISATKEQGQFLEDYDLRPRSTKGDAGLHSLTGTLWEWTGSAYLPYPGYKRPQGHLLEYNSKFMVNQMVLRGGAFATPRSHFRLSYRNFYAPEKRWCFSGFRLAESL